MKRADAAKAMARAVLATVPRTDVAWHERHNTTVWQQTITECEAALSALSPVLEGARDALGPFAADLSNWRPEAEDGQYVSANGEGLTDITVGDLRSASSAHSMMKELTDG